MPQRQWRSDDTDQWVYGFGTGSDGTSYVAPANAGCSGTSSSTTLTLDAASTFANGDLVLIHQTRGTGAGNWELNKIASGGGTTTLTLSHALTNTYTDSGASQAQIIEMKEYSSLSVTTTVTVPAWDGNIGGIAGFFANTSFSGNGSITANGKGFLGGVGVKNQGQANSGEGTVGGSVAQRTANGNGGGGGQGDDVQGGGGGHSATGSNGFNRGNFGLGGNSAGDAGLTTLVFGGGGGGGAEYEPVIYQPPTGGSGGGAIFIFAKSYSFTGTISVNGANGTTGDNVGSGSGAGGSVLIKAETATLGTNLVTATGGGAVLSHNGGTGGAASSGRIHIDYSGSFTGTTNPTIDSRLDATIIPFAGGRNNYFYFM